MITGLQVNLACADPARSLAFYAGLGLPEVFRAAPDGVLEHAEVEGAGVRVGLTLADALVRHVGLDPRPGTPHHADVELVLWCDDVDDRHARALAGGGVEVVAPADSGDGRLRWAWLGDPDGHRVKLVQPRTRPTD